MLQRKAKSKQYTNPCTVKRVQVAPGWSDLIGQPATGMQKYRVAIKVKDNTVSYWVDVVEAESFQKVLEHPVVLTQIIKSGIEINMLDISVMEWLEWDEFTRNCN